MVGQLAGVISKILGFVFGDNSKSHLQKRIEWLRVNKDFHGGRYQVDGGGHATVTGRNPGYGVGNVVPVVMDKGTPVAIVGHEMLKAQFHPTGGVDVEQVEELIITTNTNPDGGVDLFLRSWRGLFYLDVRAAVAAVLPDPSQYIQPGTNTTFPINPVASLTRWGANDNTLAVFVAGADSFIVIYVFKINRRVGSDAVPVIEETKVIGSVEHPIVDLSLVAFYDFALMSIPSGISVSVAGSSRQRQNYYFYEHDVEYTWNGSSYEITNTTFKRHETQVVQDVTHGYSNSFSIVIDFAHNNVTPNEIPSPYNWNFQDFWMDFEDRPVLNLELRLNDGSSVLYDFMGYDSAGELVPLSTIPGISSAFWKGSVGVSAGEFVERPTVIVRLTQDSLNGTIDGVLLGKTCPDAMSHSVTTDAWNNIPQVENLDIGGAGAGTLLGTLKANETRIGGPTPGSLTVYSTASSWSASLTTPSPGSQQGNTPFEFKSPATFVATSFAKPELVTLYKGGAYVLGASTNTVWFVTLLPQPSHKPEYISHNVVIFGIILNGSFPASRQQSIAYGMSQRSAANDFDGLLYLRHTTSAIAEGVCGLWRVRDGIDSAIVYVSSGNVSGTTNWPNPVLNRQFVLLENIILGTNQKELRTIDNSLTIAIPAALKTGFNLALLAPGRLFDKRETVKKFLSTSDPSVVLNKPKALAGLSGLTGFTISDSPSRMLHTVGSLTKKES